MINSHTLWDRSSCTTNTNEPLLQVFPEFPVAGKRQMRLIIEGVKICLDGNSVATFCASAAHLFPVRGNELMAEGHTLALLSQDDPDAQRSRKKYRTTSIIVLSI